MLLYLFLRARNHPGLPAPPLYPPNQSGHNPPTSALTLRDIFAARPINGDLGTVQNFNCLRSQRTPNAYPQESLDNVVFQLGASHTLWNVASTIFTQHFGNPKVATDTRAWQFLEALGFPSEKAIHKKDFTLMINQMEQVTESIIYYGLRVIMKSNCKPGTEEKVKLPTAEWNSIVDECYSSFCTRKARQSAKGCDSPRIYNTLLMLHDFSTVVEAKRSMKAGDIGRLMSVWKKWSLMAQALPGITNYSSYLPRQVLLLTVILPPSLSKYRHNLLMSPTSRPDHFVAKDFWLEIQNYWLKFLYNRSGMGTNMDRLRDIFSLNITMLQTMMQDLKTDCGSNIIHQSHKNGLSQRDFDMFTLMANNRDILDQFSKNQGPTITATDFYLTGISKLQTHIRQNDASVNKFKKHLTANHQEHENEGETREEGGEFDEESDESCDM
ncbi:hypothetical protein MJO29_003549 [Puccinia striiformis f. sp. tritici]|nr:hypothetical protein MJO29_003549 [Puccinia striiformis f. sp. tritici]